MHARVMKIQEGIARLSHQQSELLSFCPGLRTGYLPRKNDSGTPEPVHPQASKQRSVKGDDKEGKFQTYISAPGRKLLCDKVRKRSLHFLKRLPSEINVNMVLY